MSDCHDHCGQKIIAEKADFIVKEIVYKIFESKLEIRRRIDLSEFEISLIHKWPIYVGINIFINLMLNVIHNKNADLCDAKLDNKYFNNKATAIQSFYYDFSINYALLKQLSEIIDNTFQKKNKVISVFETSQNAAERVPLFKKRPEANYQEDLLIL